MMEAAFVYIHRDCNKPALFQLYEGLLAVITRGPKVVTVMRGSQKEFVSVNRLKPHKGKDPVEAGEGSLW